jgi:chemotaxis protein histidine kinase CheA
MEKLKGAIEVESQTGSGATFTVCVPEKWQDTTGIVEPVRLT